MNTFLYCPNAWALRHRFINQAKGEMIRACCNRWDCLVGQWRQLVKAAESTLFLTLSKAGKTVEEAARALTVFMHFLRRGSKGKGQTSCSEILRQWERKKGGSIVFCIGAIPISLLCIVPAAG